METSLSISIVALLVAALSALYSRWTVSAAKKANEISIHSEKLLIYKAFIELRTELTMSAEGFKHQALYDFYRPASLAEFYFSPETTKLVDKVIETAEAFLYSRTKWERQEKRSERNKNYDDELDNFFELTDKFREDIRILNIQMRKELRLTKL